MRKASTWNRIMAGHYERVGSDGSTVLAYVTRAEDGTWSFMVTPFGSASLGWQVTGYPTMTEAQRMAAAGYRSYMNNHREMNKGN